MAVLYSDDPPSPWRPTDYQCYLCLENVEPSKTPAVFWHSGRGDLVLHPACAIRLGAALIADAREATLAGPDRKWDARVEKLADSRAKLREQ